MKIYVKKVSGLVVPTQATPDDAGYDCTAFSEPIIVGDKIDRPADGIIGWNRIDYIEYKTQLFISPETLIAYGGVHKFHTLLFPRSSVSKKNMLLCNSIGLIDNGYRGEICFRFKYVFQPEDLRIVPEHGTMRLFGVLRPDSIYQRGDRIGQLVAAENVKVDFELVDLLDNTVRGSGGFGSTN